MTKYRSHWQEIDKVEVEKETESYVWIGGRQRRKVTDFECYHDTFEQAKSHIVGCAKSEVEGARRKLDYAEKKLAKAQAAELSKQLTSQSQ